MSAGFSEAYILLNRARSMAQRQTKDFYTIRDILKSAKSAVLKDTVQSESLKSRAAQAINRAISYTYSRTNPAPPFSPMNFQSFATPISPYQTKQGPFGYVKGPIIPSQPDLVPTLWTQRGREDFALAQMIVAAITIVRQGLGR